MDTQIGYEQLRYAVWTVSYSNPIPSGYAQNRIWADSLNEAIDGFFIHLKPLFRDGLAFNLCYVVTCILTTCIQ